MNTDNRLGKYIDNATMTIKELSAVMEVGDKTLRGYIKKIYPHAINNGIETRLNEAQITKIKHEVLKNKRLTSSVAATEVKTDLDYEIMAEMVSEHRVSKINRLTEINKQLENRVNLLIHDKKTYTATEIAKELNMKSATELNKLLQTKEVQYKLNGTWVLTAKYSGLDYEKIKQQELDNGKIIYNRHWTGRGRDFIINKLKEVTE